MRLAVAAVVALAGCRYGFDRPGVGDSDDAGSTAIDGAPLDAPDRPNRAFVTSTDHSAALGGLAGADAVCAARAVAGGLPGTFIAFLRTSTVDPVDRLVGSRGWVRVDGEPLYDRVEDIIAEKQMFPLTVTELGTTRSSAVWSGAGPSGRLRLSLTNNCMGWTSGTDAANISLGQTTATSGGTFCGGSADCGAARPLYCFEVGHVAPVSAPAPAAGRIIFASTQRWMNGSLASADAICNGEAVGAGLPGSYRALLATTGQSAGARVGNLTGPWRRTDGMVVTRGDLGTGTLVVPPNRTADGSALTELEFAEVWTGAAGLTTAGTTVSTCNSWTATSGIGAFANADLLDFGFTFGGFGDTCGLRARHLYCAQE